MSVYSTFTSVSGQKLEKAFWPAKGETKAVLQLVHGMAEHIRRYDESARKLNEAASLWLAIPIWVMVRMRIFWDILARKADGMC